MARKPSEDVEAVKQKVDQPLTEYAEAREALLADGVQLTEALAGPDDDVYWQTYNPRFEIPISYLLAIFAMGLGLLIFLGIRSVDDGPPQKPGAKIGTVDGPDDTGDGSEGSGGVIDPIALGANTPTAEDIKNILPTPDLTLPQIKEDLNNRMKLEDPNSVTPIASNNAAALSALDQQLQDKLMGIGQKKGSGGPGTEGENDRGTGKGGTGADATRSRSLRWVITFKTGGGRDYLDQLHALGAVIFVPKLDDNKKLLYFGNLSNPGAGVLDSDGKELARQMSKMQFHDFSSASCADIQEALDLKFKPRSFIAFFPKSFEEDLAKKETGHAQRRSADIDETKFQVVRRGGSYEVYVTGPSLKK